MSEGMSGRMDLKFKLYYFMSHLVANLTLAGQGEHSSVSFIAYNGYTAKQTYEYVTP
jgi:hypothetical protein